jgi:uncharacterized protein YyaL (SSP411 family)
MPNRLAKETSPYLLQHKNNPVDWYPWGQEAFDAAKKQDKPIFLSVGYSACHWCHVMEHESFENADIAKQMNAGFICIKVDREERPDVDQIYMNAVQSLTGRGGWPMSVFLTHDLKPFYGGTYWPPKRGRGMPGFDEVLVATLDAWKNRRAALNDQAQQLTDHLKVVGNAGTDGKDTAKLKPELFQHPAESLAKLFDTVHGGFGGAPKFPHPMDLRVLLRIWKRTGDRKALDQATFTLDKMARGGIYDHLAGGFHRYSVDARWLIPHFEKMLYDNALLAVAYAEAYQATGREDYARTLRETLDYVLREMTTPDGAFSSTQDADSEGEEGKFYVWTVAEVTSVLGADQGKLFCEIYDVTARGNFEPEVHAGRSQLNLPQPLEDHAKRLNRNVDELRAELSAARAKLLEVRSKRVAPGLDDKVLTSWNGLMIDAMATSGRVLGEPRYTAAAQKAAAFITTKLRRADGRLLHSFRHGQAKFDAYLDDYACLAQALTSLYETDFDARWIDEATKLCDVMLKHFADVERGGFYYTADDHEQLIARNKDVYDNATPSGTGVALTVLMRLGKLTGNAIYQSAAERGFATIGELFERAPTAVGQSFIALDLWLGPTQEIVVAAEDAASRDALMKRVNHAFWPNKVLAALPGQGASKSLEAVLAGKKPQKQQPTLFVCENFTCQAPVTGEAIDTAIGKYAKRTH